VCSRQPGNLTVVGVFRRTAGGRRAGDDKRNRPARHRTANDGGVVASSSRRRDEDQSCGSMPGGSQDASATTERRSCLRVFRGGSLGSPKVDRGAVEATELWQADTVEIQNTKEWTAYVEAPSAETLATLLRVSAASARALISLMVENERASDDWRLANHLAIACTENRYATEAMYYAQRAVAATDDVRARISMVRALELRRFPAAVLSELEEIRPSLRQLRGDRILYERARCFVACAYVRAYCYIGWVDPALRWFESVRRSPYSESDAYLALFRAISREESRRHGEVYRLTTLSLATEAVSLSGRDRAGLLSAARRLLLTVLGRRVHE